jgi:uncharacterized membrane protein YphA (DoxX/SURF4 family)
MYADSTNKPLVFVHWGTRIVAGGILLMGAIPKFTGAAAELAEKLPGGTITTTAIGIAELIAVVLMFVPKTSLIGSALAAMIMLGAVASHVIGPVGFEGDFAMMFGLALIALLSSLAATAVGYKRSGLPIALRSGAIAEATN